MSDNRSLNEIAAAVGADLSELVRAQADLIREEMSEKLSVLAKAGAAMAIGGALLWGGYLCGLAAIVIGLSYVMPAAWAALLVGGVAALVGYSLVVLGRRQASPETMKLERSARELRKNLELMKEQTQ